jgi:WW domain-containing oxidoreductase
MARKATAEQITEGYDLTGKVALVTGVNSGIGTETMRVLAMRGAKVLGTARTLEKAESACANIIGDTIPLVCELTDLENVRACADAIERLGLGGIDIVVANAGIMALPDLQQVNGIEMQFATNHLGHFLLLNLLLPLIGKSGPARVVVVSSSAHAQAPKMGIDFDNLSGEAGYSGWRAYGQSKLANVLFARQLNQYLPEHSTANALHPGIIATNLGRHMQGGFTKVFGLAMLPFMVTIPQGAATSCYVAVHADVEGKAGEYFANCKTAKASALAGDKHLAEKLWQVSAQLVGLGSFSKLDQ